jgi:CRISPR/Cas system-associated endonuclease Cas1
MLRSRKPDAERRVDPRIIPGSQSEDSGELPAQVRLSRSKHVAPVKPSNVLTLTGDSASISVKRGALIATRDGMSLVYEPRAVKPNAIVLTGWGGVVTLAALRFCAKHKIAVVILDWDRDFMTAMALPSRRAARIARAQLEAMSPNNALAAAKALVAAKIDAHACVGAIARAKAETAIERARLTRSGDC